MVWCAHSVLYELQCSLSLEQRHCQGRPDGGAKNPEENKSEF